MNTMTVFARHVYGKPLCYPADATARKFAALLNLKTFSDQQLQGIEALGFTIEMGVDPATRRTPA